MNQDVKAEKHTIHYFYPFLDGTTCLLSLSFPMLMPAAPKKNTLHFISIGGSVMHSLAIALHQKGYHVTGSDDDIYEPSRSKLKDHGLLPDKMGWNPTRITDQLDAVILGMHAKAENPELLKAQELKLPIYSYPEYIAPSVQKQTTHRHHR